MDMLCISSTWNCRSCRYVPVNIKLIVQIIQIPADDTCADHTDHTDPTEANVWSDLQIVQIPSRKYDTQIAQIIQIALGKHVEL